MTALTSSQRRVLGYWLGGLILPCLALTLLFRWLSRDRAESGAWERALQVASILPDDVVFLHHLPHVRDAQTAWGDADSWRVWRSPAVAAFLDEPLAEIEEMSLLRQSWEHALDLDPSEAFLAASLDTWGHPQFLAALHRERVPSNFDPAWDEIRSWLSARLGEPVAVEAGREGDHYERFDDGRSVLVLARGEAWCFLANRRAPIDDALERLRKGEGGTGDSLAGNALFAQAFRRLPGDYVSATFIRSLGGGAPGSASAASESVAKAGARDPGWWSRFCSASKTLSGAEISAMGLTSSVRDQKMVGFGTYLTRGKVETPPEELGEATLRLTSPDTLMYVATSLKPAKACSMLLEAPEAELSSGGAPRFEEDWFLPEWSLQLEPTSRDGRRAPAVLVASFTLSRPDAFERYLEQRRREPGGGVRREGLGTYAISSSHLPAPWPDLVPQLYVQQHAHLVLISNERPILSHLRRRWSGNEKTLESRRDYQRLRRQLPSGDVALVFVDSRQLLATAYEAVQHPLIIGALWMSLRSQTSLKVDFDKLPRTEAVGAELTPTLMVVRTTASGYEQAAVGSLSPGQWLVGGGLVAALVDHTLLKPLPKAVRDPFITPLETMELKAQLESSR